MSVSITTITRNVKLAQAELTDKQRQLADTMMDKFFRVLPQVDIVM